MQSEVDGGRWSRGKGGGEEEVWLVKKAEIASCLHSATRPATSHVIPPTVNMQATMQPLRGKG